MNSHNPFHLGWGESLATRDFVPLTHQCKKNLPHPPTVLLLTLPGAFLGRYLPATLGYMLEDDPTFARPRRFGISFGI